MTERLFGAWDPRGPKDVKSATDAARRRGDMHRPKHFPGLSLGKGGRRGRRNERGAVPDKKKNAPQGESEERSATRPEPLHEFSGERVVRDEIEKMGAEGNIVEVRNRLLKKLHLLKLQAQWLKKLESMSASERADFEAAQRGMEDADAQLEAHWATYDKAVGPIEFPTDLPIEKRGARARALIERWNNAPNDEQKEAAVAWANREHELLALKEMHANTVRGLSGLTVLPGEELKAWYGEEFDEELLTEPSVLAREQTKVENGLDRLELHGGGDWATWASKQASGRVSGLEKGVYTKEQDAALSEDSHYGTYYHEKTGPFGGGKGKKKEVIVESLGKSVGRRKNPPKDSGTLEGNAPTHTEAAALPSDQEQDVPHIVSKEEFARVIGTLMDKGQKSPEHLIRVFVNLEKALREEHGFESATHDHKRKLYYLFAGHLEEVLIVTGMPEGASPQLTLDVREEFRKIVAKEFDSRKPVARAVLSLIVPFSQRITHMRKVVQYPGFHTVNIGKPKEWKDLRLGDTEKTIATLQTFEMHMRQLAKSAEKLA